MSDTEAQAVNLKVVPDSFKFTPGAGSVRGRRGESDTSPPHGTAGPGLPAPAAAADRQLCHGPSRGLGVTVSHGPGPSASADADAMMMMARARRRRRTRAARQ